MPKRKKTLDADAVGLQELLEGEAATGGGVGFDVAALPGIRAKLMERLAMVAEAQQLAADKVPDDTLVDPGQFAQPQGDPRVLAPRAGSAAGVPHIFLGGSPVPTTQQDTARTIGATAALLQNALTEFNRAKRKREAQATGGPGDAQ